jgi:hypothetical protein
VVEEVVFDIVPKDVDGHVQHDCRSVKDRDSPREQFGTTIEMDLPLQWSETLPEGTSF